jgi:hypothetical protein
MGENNGQKQLHKNDSVSCSGLFRFFPIHKSFLFFSAFSAVSAVRFLVLAFSVSFPIHKSFLFFSAFSAVSAVNPFVFCFSPR